MKACQGISAARVGILDVRIRDAGRRKRFARRARRVLKLLTPLKAAKVNLIPWNPGALPYHESPPEVIELSKSC